LRVRIEVKGSDDVKSKLKGFTLASLQEWARRIEAEARTDALGKLAPEIAQHIRIEVSEIEPKLFELKADMNREAIPLLIEATKNSLRNMPFGFQAIFKSFLKKSEEAIREAP